MALTGGSAAATLDGARPPDSDQLRGGIRMAPATLTINSRNYGAWSLRGWLLCRMAGLEVVEEVLPSGDPAARAELLLLSPSFLVPRLEHEGVTVWDALAIAEYLQDRFPHAGLLPDEPVARAHCRSISAEVHGGFLNLRSALPMNMTAQHTDFPVFSGARADIARITAIWRDCLGKSRGPYLFGARPTMADAMFAPICSRFATYDVALDATCAAYRDVVLALPDVVEWAALAAAEPQELVELEAEF
jgi:glutathione S-transferase